MRNLILMIAGVACASISALAAEGDPKGNISDFLANIDAGVVSAGDVLGLSSSAITTVQTPKDLIVALSSASSDKAKAGFGISFTPARSGVDGMAVSLADYTAPGNTTKRLWGATTFSYAQNIQAISGVDYRQDAIAVHLSYYLDPDEDPVVASVNAFKAAGCRSAQSGDQILAAMAAKRVELGHSLNAKEQQALRGVLQGTLSIKEALALDAKVAGDCIEAAVKKAKAKWNASQIALTAGQGWIRSPAADAARLTLARHITLSGAVGAGNDGLLNLTLRRVSHEVDLTTLAATPQYRTSTLAAVRYTLGYGNDRDTYAIAEISNAKADSPTLSNAAFKYALGVDHKVGENMWLEFRLGRSRVVDGGGQQTAALLGLKFAPSTTLPKPGS